MKRLTLFLIFSLSANLLLISIAASADEAVLDGSAGCCPPAGDAAAESVVPCGPGSDTPPTTCTPSEGKLITVEFLYLDLSVCGRCQGSDSGLDAAVAEARPVLESLGIELAVDKVHVQTEEQARALRFASSPTIRINGVDIAPEILESFCEDCGDICGDSVDCREWEYDGETYAVPPKAMILEAIFKAIYAETPVDERPYEDVPDNLKRFFGGKKN